MSARRFGIFPIIISWWMALALTIYMAVRLSAPLSKDDASKY